MTRGHETPRRVRAGYAPRNAFVARRVRVGKHKLRFIEFTTMSKTLHSSRLMLALVVAVAIVSATAMSGIAFAGDAPPPESSTTTFTASTPSAARSPAAPVNGSEVTPKSYAPIVTNGWPPLTLFGIETANLAGQATQILGTGTTWIRRNALQWKDVEPTQGARNWSAASAIEADMIAAANANARLILIVHGTPGWAQQINNAFCGPIRSDKIGAFAAFMRDAVARYSRPPFNVKYWEIWNEPDLQQPGASANPILQPYGCWGNQNDPYFGGGYYASVLANVTPQIKAVDPAAKVLLGGLLLGCNPNNPPPGDNCLSGKYLEGILRNNGAAYFDGVSFHAYDFFDTGANVPGKFGGGTWGTASNTTGPVLIAKTQFIKNLLNQFGVTDKFLMNTEVGLLCYECAVAPSQFETSKAYYVAQAYSAAIAEGLTANVWYSFEGWYLSGLNDPSNTAFKVARAKLGDVIYAGAITNSDVGSGGVKGYKFTRGAKSVWVVWSLDGGAKNLTLPGTPATVTDALGASVTAAATLPLTVKPLYIEWP